MGRHTVFGKVNVRTYVGDQVQVSLADIPADGVVDWHAHPQEQLGVVVEGRALFQIGDEEKELGPGDVFYIPGNVHHRVVPLGGPVKAVDIFHPIRDEYR